MGEYKKKEAEEIYRNMSAIRSKDNKTETALRLALHRMGLRYRKHRRDLPGVPDIVFPGKKLAVFVDGDFWHGRVLKENGIVAAQQRIKSPNRAYWISKFERNVSRDDAVNEELSRRGWRVLRYWESEVKNNVRGIATEIASILRGM